MIHVVAMNEDLRFPLEMWRLSLPGAGGTIDGSSRISVVQMDSRSASGDLGRHPEISIFPIATLTYSDELTKVERRVEPANPPVTERIMIANDNVDAETSGIIGRTR